MWSIKTFFGLNRLVRLDVGMKVATIEAISKFVGILNKRLF